MNGALLIHKPSGVSSFGVIELLQNQLMKEKGLKRRDLPKVGHGGTLDPFATGLLIVLIGKGVKLARYFLGSVKSYEGKIRFGAATLPGDPTAPISETSEILPRSLSQIQEATLPFIHQPYHQVPPMFSAIKKDGVRLYELAREGQEVEREPRLCQIYHFDIKEYQNPFAFFQVDCSAGTYIRTLAQDLAKNLGTLAFLETLHRTTSGVFNINQAWGIEQINTAVQEGKAWDELPCWMPFDQLLQGYPFAEATQEERQALIHGKQGVLFNIIKKINPPARLVPAKEDFLAIYFQNSLIAVAKRDEGSWGIERVFTSL